MGHIDYPDHAKGYGQANGGQDQHRTGTEPEKQGFKELEKGNAGIDITKELTSLRFDGFILFIFKQSYNGQPHSRVQTTFQFRQSRLFFFQVIVLQVGDGKGNGQGVPYIRITFNIHSVCQNRDSSRIKVVQHLVDSRQTNFRVLVTKIQAGDNGFYFVAQLVINTDFF